MVGSSDVAKLTAFVRAALTDQDDNGQLGAPVGDVYQSHTSDIMETLADLLNQLGVHSRHCANRRPLEGASKDWASDVDVRAACTRRA